MGYAIFGGLLFRIFSICFFAKIGLYWLKPEVFKFYIIFLITLPVWTIITAFINLKGIVKHGNLP